MLRRIEFFLLNRIFRAIFGGLQRFHLHLR